MGICPDLTVESGVPTLRRFPSDLLETSVDPETPVDTINEANGSIIGTKFSVEKEATLEKCPMTLSLSRPQVWNLNNNSIDILKYFIFFFLLDFSFQYLSKISRS